MSKKNITVKEFLNTEINTSVCPDCFSDKFYQLPDKSWKCFGDCYKPKK